MAHFDSFSAHHSPADLARRPIYERLGKRLLDIALSLILLPILLPLILLLWVLARRDGGPGFYAHTRIGRHGRRFKCWKIRTMILDADVRLAAHLATDPHAAREWERAQKLTNDPRITRLGRVLRRTSLDELPQIWNVLLGEMSLVGPRPVTLAELDRYGAQRASYLRMRPGITGLWQVKGRGNGCYTERLALDQAYAQTQSLPLDLRLILRTALVLFWPTGR